MKKMSLLIVLFLSFMIMPVVYAKDKVSIESVTIDSKSDSTEVINDATYDGLAINFDVKFFGVNDYIKYKVVVDNPTNKDYEIINNSDLNLGEYISYDYSYGESSNIIKKNSQMTMYINIKYDKEVPSNLFNNGIFTERNNMTISLGNNDNNIVNPKTSNYIFICIIILMIIGVSIVVFSPFKNKKYYSFIIISLLLIPISIYAIEKLEINIDSNVVISNNPKFCYTYEGQSYYFEYEDGMTWGDYINSSFNKGIFEIDIDDTPVVKEYTVGEKCGFIYNNNIDLFNATNTVKINDFIGTNGNGCYTVSLVSCRK